MAVVPGEAWAEKAAAVADSDQLLTIGDVERTLRVVRSPGGPETRVVSRIFRTFRSVPRSENLRSRSLTFRCMQ